jgi:hypothetical protein
MHFCIYVTLCIYIYAKVPCESSFLEQLISAALEVDGIGKELETKGPSWMLASRIKSSGHRMWTEGYISARASKNGINV